MPSASPALAPSPVYSLLSASEAEIQRRQGDLRNRHAQGSGMLGTEKLGIEMVGGLSMLTTKEKRCHAPCRKNVGGKGSTQINTHHLHRGLSTSHRPLPWEWHRLFLGSGTALFLGSGTALFLEWHRPLPWERHQQQATPRPCLCQPCRRKAQPPSSTSTGTAAGNAH